MKDAWIATTRFGMGPAPGELSEAATDPRGWLEAQLDSPEAPPALADLPTSADEVQQFLGQRGASEAAKDAFKQHQRDALQNEARAMCVAAASSPSPFVERLTAFWTNHLTVSAVRREVTSLAGPFAREVTRAHTLGTFRGMLHASARHPAMLVYLDNVRSIGPDSMAGRRSGRGLNENLAREILELHTLGVDGGYVQADVEALAAMLTGWGMESMKDGMAQVNTEFSFEARRHQPGPKTLLGVRYPEAFEGEARAALTHLSEHPSTARHLATKLARHFIADDPPPVAIAHIEAAYRDTDGDLKEVARALIHCPECWSTPPSKLKSPWDLVISAARAFGWQREGKAMLVSLDNLGQRPFFSPGPDGWPDHSAEWLGPQALLARLEWAELLASQSIHKVDPDQVVEDTVGPVLTRSTRSRLASAEPTRKLALLVASPEFQRR